MAEGQEPAAHERSGEHVADAIGEAERGAAVPDTHTHPEQTKSHEAHVELIEGDPAMTEGRSAPGQGGKPLPSSGPPAEGSSGGAQSAPGARVSDRVAGGEPVPEGP